MNKNYNYCNYCNYKRRRKFFALLLLLIFFIICSGNSSIEAASNINTNTSSKPNASPDQGTSDSASSGDVSVSLDSNAGNYDWSREYEDSKGGKPSAKREIGAIIDQEEIYIAEKWGTGKKKWEQNMQNIRSAKLKGDLQEEAYKTPDF
ncbi:MAG: hypothetical protein HQK51_04060 [Oligoflexia bacterium]|nr:hypothetical protein [Oligoflexia bacterium]